MSDSAAIPADVRSLILGRIESVVQLELLLLLHRDATTSWTTDEVARELRIEPAWAAAQLNHLRQQGLLGVGSDASGTEIYRYDPASPALRGAVDGLARAYVDRRVTVIAMIYAPPTDTLRSFADAFRLRKDKGSDG